MNRLLKLLKKINLSISNPIPQDQKYEIGFLVLWVGTKCTLRCRDCGNLIPYVAPASFDMDQIISDMNTLLSFCRVNKLQIQGGEPFTNPKIGKLIDRIDNFNIPEIVITTNGTIRLNQQIIKSLKNVKNSNFQMVLSSYECARNKQDEFYSVLVSNHINCLKYDFYQKDGSWVNQGGPETCRNNDDQKTQELYSQCAFKICLSLVNGELFRCGRAKVSSEVFGLQYDSNDYLNIRKIGDAAEGLSEIVKFLNNPHFKEYCRYCLGTEEKIPPAIQLSAASKAVIGK